MISDLASDRTFSQLPNILFKIYAIINAFEWKERDVSSPTCRLIPKWIGRHDQIKEPVLWIIRDVQVTRDEHVSCYFIVSIILSIKGRFITTPKIQL